MPRTPCFLALAILLAGLVGEGRVAGKAKRRALPLLEPPRDQRVQGRIDELERLERGAVSADTLAKALAALKDVSPDVRATALSVLARRELAIAEVLPRLVGALADRDARVRAMAVYAVGERGPEAASAAPRLIKLLADDKVGGLAGEMTEQALHKLGSNAVPHVLRALPRAKGATRIQLIAALGRLSPGDAVRALVAGREEGLESGARALQPAPRGAPELLKVLADSAAPSTARARAAVLLGLLGAPGARAALGGAASAGDPQLALAAADALLRNELAAPPDASAKAVAALRHRDAAVRARATSILGRLPSTAQTIDAVLPLTADRSKPVREAAFKLLRAAWGRLTTQQQALLVERRAKSVADPFSELLGWGPPPAAIPRLLELLHRQRLRSGFFARMYLMGPEAAAAIRPALKHRDVAVRRNALETLARLGPAADSAVPELTSCLRDSDGTVRLLAVWALGRIGAPAAPAAPALIEVLAEGAPRGTAAEAALLDLGAASVAALIRGLADKRDAVRARVASILGGLGSSAAPATAALVTAAAETSARVRGAAVRALGRANPRDPAAASAVLRALQDRTPAVRLAASTAAGALSPTLPGLVAALATALADRSIAVRREAAHALGRLGPPARAALAALGGISRDADPEVRSEVASALFAIDPIQALPVLTQRLRDGNDKVKATALELVARAGPRASSAAAALGQLMKRSAEQKQCATMEAAARTLWRVAPNPAPILSAGLRALTQDEDETTPAGARFACPEAALEVLAVLGSKAAPALNPLLEYLVKLEITIGGENDSDLEAVPGAARDAVAHVFGKMGAAALPALVAAVRSKRPGIARRAAIEGIAEIKKSTPEARAALKAALKDESKDIQQAARDALRKLGGEP